MQQQPSHHHRYRHQQQNHYNDDNHHYLDDDHDDVDGEGMIRGRSSPMKVTLKGLVLLCKACVLKPTTCVASLASQEGLHSLWIHMAFENDAQIPHELI